MNISLPFTKKDNFLPLWLHLEEFLVLPYYHMLAQEELLANAAKKELVIHQHMKRNIIQLRFSEHNYI
jgi:hypothetical protein